MKLLFASPHRDLLDAYERVLADEGIEVVPAFEGTQVFRLAEKEEVSFAVVDRETPRVPVGKVLEFLKEKKIPTIVLLPERMRTRDLLFSLLPQDYLSFPFSPGEMTEKIRNLEYLKEKEDFSFLSVTVSPKEFLLCGSFAVTSSEILLLEALTKGAVQADAELNVITDALNEKLKSTGTRIVWREGCGYEWRKENE